jgi:hypothetical protein
MGIENPESRIQYSVSSIEIRSTKDYVRKNKLFLQNKANFRKVKLNVNKVLTKDYDEMDTWSIRKTKPIKANKSQLNPIKANFRANMSSRGTNDRIEQSAIPYNNVSNICRLTWEFIGSTMAA